MKKAIKPKYTFVYPDDDPTRAMRRAKVVVRWDCRSGQWLVGAVTTRLVKIGRMLRGAHVDGVIAAWDDVRQGFCVYREDSGEHERAILKLPEAIPVSAHDP